MVSRRVQSYSFADQRMSLGLCSGPARALRRRGRPAARLYRLRPWRLAAGRPQKLMRWRVLMQFVALVVVMLTVWMMRR